MPAAPIAIVGFVQPVSRYAYEQLRFELRSGALGASIKVGEFTNIGRRMTLRVERSENEGTDLFGVFLRAESRDGRTLAVSAERGTFLATDDANTILFRLATAVGPFGARLWRAAGVELPPLRLPDRPAVDRLVPRARQRHPGADPPELFRQGGRRALADGVWMPAAQRGPRQFPFRLVEVVMMMLLPLLAVRLAGAGQALTSGLGIFLSIAMVVTYPGQPICRADGRPGSLRSRHRFGVPFVLFAALICGCTAFAHNPGGQPIGLLEQGLQPHPTAHPPPVSEAKRAGRRRRGMIPALLSVAQGATYMARLFVTRSLAVLFALVPS